MAKKNAIAAAVETNGSAATAEKPKRQQMNKRIRAIIGSHVTDEVQKKEIVDYINGLLKQINA